MKTNANKLYSPKIFLNSYNVHDEFLQVFLWWLPCLLIYPATAQLQVVFWSVLGPLSSGGKRSSSCLSSYSSGFTRLTGTNTHKWQKIKSVKTVRKTVNTLCRFHTIWRNTLNFSPDYKDYTNVLGNIRNQILTTAASINWLQICLPLNKDFSMEEKVAANCAIK